MSKHRECGEESEQPDDPEEPRNEDLCFHGVPLWDICEECEEHDDAFEGDGY